MLGSSGFHTVQKNLAMYCTVSRWPFWNHTVQKNVAFYRLKMALLEPYSSEERSILTPENGPSLTIQFRRT
jgi:hypothetical protein